MLFKVGTNLSRTAMCLPGHRWQAAAIVFVTLLVYLNSFPGTFIWDDHTIVVNNPLVNSLDLKGIFLSDYWMNAGSGNLYRPVTILSLALNRALLGSSALAFHLINVLLHAGVCLLLWQMLRRWGFAPPLALLSALLFAVHPIHGEVVNVAVGRSELLVAVFLLAAFCIARKVGPWSVVLTCALFALALLSKEHAIAFVLLLPLLDIFANQTWRLQRERLILHGAVLATALTWLAWRAGSGILEVKVMNNASLYAPLAGLSWPERVLTALKLQWIYLGKLLLPVQLHGVYSGDAFPEVLTGFWSVPAIASVCGTVLLVSLCAIGWLRWRQTALFTSFYLLAFLPTSNLFLPIGSSFADRLTYFPSLWFCCGVAALFIWLSAKVSWPSVGKGCAVAYMVLLAILCGVRNQDYSSEATLWRADIKSNPGNVLAWFNLAETLAAQGRVQEAEPAFRKVLELRPDFTVGWRSWAMLLVTQGRAEEAIGAAQKALVNQDDDYARLIMAMAYLKLGQVQAALDWLEAVADRLEHDANYWETRGRALKQSGNCQTAVEALQKVPLVFGSDVVLEMAACQYELGQLEEAERLYTNAVDRLGHDSATVWNTLGVVRARLDRKTEAAGAFRQAVLRAPDNLYYKANLNRSQQQLTQAK